MSCERGRYSVVWVKPGGERVYLGDRFWLDVPPHEFTHENKRFVVTKVHDHPGRFSGFPGSIEVEMRCDYSDPQYQA